MVAKKVPLERDIEKAVCEYARSKGVLALKFTSPQRAACPDRLFIAKGGVMWFCEFKRGGAKPTAAQEREHARLRALDVRVYVIDDVERGKFMVDMEAGC